VWPPLPCAGRRCAVGHRRQCSRARRGRRILKRRCYEPPPVLDLWGHVKEEPHHGAARWWCIHPSVNARADEGAHGNTIAFLSSLTSDRLAQPFCGAEKREVKEESELGFDGEPPTQGFVQPGITLGHQIRTSGRRRLGREAGPSGRERLSRPRPRLWPGARWRARREWAMGPILTLGCFLLYE
jgi:hypothetical protein